MTDANTPAPPCVDSSTQESLQATPLCTDSSTQESLQATPLSQIAGSKRNRDYASTDSSADTVRPQKRPRGRPKKTAHQSVEAKAPGDEGKKAPRNSIMGGFQPAASQRDDDIINSATVQLFFQRAG